MQQRTNVTTHRNGHTPPPAQPATPGALDVLWDGLPPKAIEQLSKPLDPSLVAARKGRAGRTFPYLEGHAAIAQANRGTFQMVRPLPRVVQMAKEQPIRSNPSGVAWGQGFRQP